MRFIISLIFARLRCRLRTPTPPSSNGCKNLWPQPQNSAFRAASSTRPSAGSSPIMRCPISPCRAAGSRSRSSRNSCRRRRNICASRRFSGSPPRARNSPRNTATRWRASRKTFGVPGDVVLAIWARETDYGSERQPHDALQVLATQAYAGKRKDFFRNEFLHALKMLQDGVPRANLRSSWGGAMGLTQFLPSEYYKYAVDFDGDGHADIWHSVPDALASAAKQLKDKGWQAGKPWAIEVRVPANVDCTVAEPSHMLPVAEWLKRGYVPAYGRKLTKTRARGRGVVAVAGRHLRPGLPDAEELLRASRNTITRISTCCSSAISPTSSAAASRSSIRGARTRSSRPRRSSRCSSGSPRSGSTATSSTARPACSRARRSAPIRRRTG